MKYLRFNIENYKGVKNASIKIGEQPIPIIGLNESGKTSILQAIFRFDSRNDQLAIAKSLQFLNRYIPTESEFSIMAEIELENEKLEDIYIGYPPAEQEQLESFLANPVLKIQRYFRINAPAVFPYAINGDESDVVQRFVQVIFSRLPRIIFLDNFLESSFPNNVEIPTTYAADQSSVLTEHQEILKNMFLDLDYPLHQYFLLPDNSSRKTTLADVSRNATEKIVSDWKKMHVSTNELDVDSFANIRLEISQDMSNLYNFEFLIIETFIDLKKTERDTIMPLSDRSLGFRWFFNFSILKCFASREKGAFIYLFDEPGSYLHDTAQKILAKAIKELAETNPVIFSTHSELLLDPEIVNINNIKIAEKNDRVINLTSFAQSKSKRTLGAMTPLYNALRSKVELESTIGKTVFVLEGIIDFYFWRMLTNEIVLLPGFGAGKNEYLMSIAIGTSKQYLAIFDGDDEGKTAIERYKRFFGEEEAKNWTKYLNSKGEEVELEDLLSKSDQVRLKTMTSSVDLKKAITLLFYLPNRDEYWGAIDNETSKNIKASIGRFKKIIKLSTGNFNFNLFG